MGEVCEREAVAINEANAFYSRFDSFFALSSALNAAILNLGITLPVKIDKLCKFR